MSSSIIIEIDKFKNTNLINGLKNKMENNTDSEECKELQTQITSLLPRAIVNNRKVFDNMFKEYDKNQFKQQWRFLRLIYTSLNK